MRRFLPIVTGILAVASAVVLASASAETPTAPNGIQLIRGFEDWKVIAPSYRPDKDHIRAILGNETAVEAMRKGTRPFPDGTILAKVAWSTRKNARFPVAVEPDKFVQVEFMIKDARKYPATGGWGFARFLGPELKPYGLAPDFVQECFGCHVPVKDNDFVFTSLPPIPR
jgi:hypothetical protein